MFDDFQDHRSAAERFCFRQQMKDSGATNAGSARFRDNGHGGEAGRPAPARNKCAADRNAVADEDAARGEVDAIGACQFKQSGYRKRDGDEIVFECARQDFGGAVQAVVDHRWKLERHGG